MAIEFKGGYINDLRLTNNGDVLKRYANPQLLGVPNGERQRNETMALALYGETLAPKLIDTGSGYLIQGFVDGETLETKARKGEDVFARAGQLLLKIHSVSGHSSGGFTRFVGSKTFLCR